MYQIHLPSLANSSSMRPGVRVATPSISHTVSEKRHAPEVAASSWCAHRNELFGGGWVNADGRVELDFGRITFERDRQSLDDLARVSSDHVAAEDAIGFLVHHQFHEGHFIPAAQGVSKRTKGGLVDRDVAKLLTRFTLGKADGAQIGLAEDRRRDPGIVDAHRTIVEQGLGHGAPFCDGNRCQHDSIGAVADRVNIRNRRLRVRIDYYRALAIHHYSRLFQTEAAGVRGTAGRIHDNV